MPGKPMIHGAIWKYWRPTAMTLPQLGTSGGAPTPRKLSTASVMMAAAQT